MILFIPKFGMTIPHMLRNPDIPFGFRAPCLFSLAFSDGVSIMVMGEDLPFFVSELSIQMGLLSVIDTCTNMQAWIVY